jgi:acyl carrier protein
MNSEQDVVELIAKQAKVEPASLTRDTKLTDLNLQSIDVVELVFAIEEKFDIEVPYGPGEQNAAGISFQSVGDIVEAVEKLLGARHVA